MSMNERNARNAETTLAHVRLAEDGTWHMHSLEEHLRQVGQMAAEFAAEFWSEDWAATADLWGDLGKCREVLFGQGVRG
jgi:CRISPR-associated endonuclease/helicase Cas3